MKKKKINNKKPAQNKAKPASALIKKASKLPSLDKNKKTVLLLTIGNKQTSAQLPEHFIGANWQCVSVNPVAESKADIIEPIYNLSGIPAGTIDAVYCCRGPERLFFYQAQKMFKECARVLKPAGEILVQTGNMEMISEIAAEKGINALVSKSAAGEVGIMDLIYGFEKWIKDGYEYAQHRCGFTPGLLAASLKANGFHNSTIDANGLNLRIKSYKLKQGEQPNHSPVIKRADINQMMQERDELDVQPKIAFEYRAKK